MLSTCYNLPQSINEFKIRSVQSIALSAAKNQKPLASFLPLSLFTSVIIATLTRIIKSGL